MPRVVTALAGTLVVVVLLSGCQKPVTEVTSSWPTATAERAVPQPAVKPRWPYTGAVAVDPAKLTRRPLSIKIENSNPSRPQIGLNSADLVYETMVEGGITRFNCIFHSRIPKVVGPVRSARLSDQWIVPQYDGLFFYSGRSSSVAGILQKYGLPDLSQDHASAAYYRVHDRAAPHNLLLDTSKTYAAARNRKYRVTAEVTPLQFDRRVVVATSTITQIQIPFSTANRVEWRYNETSGLYRRWNNGAEHHDQATGKQVTADNVVVMWAKYTQATHDMVGSVTWDIRLGGEGRVSVFHNGQRYDGTWKANRDAPPQFTDKDGRPIRLAVGRTWVQVIPLDGKITMK
ncbi:MAG: hypothetical protein CVT67_05940 [Actinobacteria bacterium HGW-Actinobacteria-7]|nr:MAG: hypothetical protein CVT67_05940 [Actinobacteria bacterium HGW-Actinobacteria-7]